MFHKRKVTQIWVHQEGGNVPGFQWVRRETTFSRRCVWKTFMLRKTRKGSARGAQSFFGLYEGTIPNEPRNSQGTKVAREQYSVSPGASSAYELFNTRTGFSEAFRSWRRKRRADWISQPSSLTYNAISLQARPSIDVDRDRHNQDIPAW